MFIKKNVDIVQEVTPFGNQFLVQLDPTLNEDGTYTVYETIVNEIPDIKSLLIDLEDWKDLLSNRMQIISNKQRMDEIVQELKDTDHFALQAFEGEDMSNHSDWKEKRANLRKEYKLLKSEIDSLQKGK